MSLTYMLRSRSDGQIELLQFDPRLVGVFPLKADAERVLALLERSDRPLSPPQGDEPASASRPDLQAVPASGAADDAVDAVQAAREALPSPPPAVEAEPDWEGAMTRLEAGEALRAVADDMGMSWTMLRGRWAQRQRGPRGADAMANCTICDREFRPSATSPDKCARCSRD